MGDSGSTPSTPLVKVASYPKLDRKQAGHLRHFYNLVAQPDGEWHHFGSADPHNEFDDAARYQLATMTYAMAVAHFHRLPALRGPFKALMRMAIHKMLRKPRLDRRVQQPDMLTTKTLLSGTIGMPRVKGLHCSIQI
jgi:hypothetical protein